jgi:hypothetical protein
VETKTKIAKKSWINRISKYEVVVHLDYLVDYLPGAEEVSAVAAVHDIAAPYQ